MAPTGVLEWGIKATMLDYVRALPDGTMTFDGEDALGLDVFVFPLVDDLRPTGQNRVVSFRGQFHSAGHHGTQLAVVIDPTIEVRGSIGRLSVVRWAGRQARLEIAEFEWPTPRAVVGGFERVLRPRLTVEGTEVFGDVYPTGTPLDDVRVVLDS